MSKPLSRVGFDDLIQTAERLTKAGNKEQAATLYRDWIRFNPKSPVLFAAHFNLGFILSEIGQMEAALVSYQYSLRCKPNFFHAQLNSGVVLEKLGRLEEAATVWRAATKNEQQAGGAENLVLAYNNLGRLLDAAKHWTEALEVFQRSLEILPDQERVLYHWIRLRQRICAWPIYAPLPGIDANSMLAKNSAIAMLSISDDPALQRASAEYNIRLSFTANPPPRLSPPTGYRHQRLRIGYLSSNFNFHPVSLIAVELFELHDRGKFEVFGFSWSPEDASPMLTRVRGAMDHFISIHNMSDEHAARLIASHEIDILIDLQGLTTGARANILTYRPAPFQINYLGHVGTTCIPGVDYILADRFVIPEKERQHYSEKVLYLPNCLQTSDRQRPHPKVTREDRVRHGLPMDAFVFCTFNNTNKFTPETFGCWMRILQRVPGSILWLLADNQTAKANLLQQACSHGVDPERLVFAGRVGYEDFLARFSMADLFLDTFPCTGGTTINDALWMDLPIVTRSGRSFASRLSGSILNALGLSQYITNSFVEYEELAVHLAEQPDQLQTYRNTVTANKATHPLFDMPQLVQQIEDVFTQLTSNTVDGQEIGSSASGVGPTETRLSIVIYATDQSDWILPVVQKIRTPINSDVQIILVSDLAQSPPLGNVFPFLQNQDLHVQCFEDSPALRDPRIATQLAQSKEVVILRGQIDLTPTFYANLKTI